MSAKKIVVVKRLGPLLVVGEDEVLITLHLLRSVETACENVPANAELSERIDLIRKALEGKLCAPAKTASVQQVAYALLSLDDGADPDRTNRLRELTV